MRVLVLGFGSMGRRHAANALRTGHDVSLYDPALVEMDITAAVEEVDKLPGRAQAWGTEEEAWASEPDAVVVATPAATHPDLFWRAMAAGVPVFVEKPLAVNVADFWRACPWNQQELTSRGFGPTLTGTGLSPNTARNWGSVGSGQRHDTLKATDNSPSSAGENSGCSSPTASSTSSPTDSAPGAGFFTAATPEPAAGRTTSSREQLPTIIATHRRRDGRPSGTGTGRGATPSESSAAMNTGPGECRSEGPEESGTAITAPVACVAFNLRFHKGLRHVLRYTAAQIGTLRHARLQLRCDRSTWNGKSYADTLAECSHELDLARWVLGPGTVSGATTVDGRVWDVLIEHDGGATSSVHIDDRWPGYRRGGELVGDTGWVHWSMDPRDGAFRARASNGNTYQRATTAEDTYRGELAHFLSAAAGGPTEPGCTLAEGLAVVGWCDAARQLANRGRLVPL